LLLCLAGCTTYQPVDWSKRAGGPRAQPQVAGGMDAVAQHRVIQGDTLSDLAVRYRMPMGDLARANRIAPPYRLYAGQILTVPAAAGAVSQSAPQDAAMVVPAQRSTRPVIEPATRPRVGEVQVASLEPDPIEASIAPPLPRERIEASRSAAGREPPTLSGEGFLWPVRGKIASGFGSKPNGTRNDGVNIRAAEGTTVVAAEHGVVVFAGDEIPGYGSMLLISHANGLLTAYAHNRNLFVAVGDRVERGQRIASVGRSGNVTSPQLHFEVRHGKEPVDPMLVLAPASTQVASAR
jgi:murein DD-endopeptidase MepM/ murein hydrolase activator NlpD